MLYEYAVNNCCPSVANPHFLMAVVLLFYTVSAPDCVSIIYTEELSLVLRYFIF
jgi:hypothetical protein